MKSITYRDEKWYHAKTQYHGIVGKKRYFVDTEPTIEKRDGDKYYTYPIIHRFDTFVIIGVFLLIAFSIGFVLVCLAKILFCLIAG